MIEVEINQAQLAEMRERLAHISNGASTAMMRALNKTSNKARTEASRDIRAKVAFTSAYLNEKDASGKRRLSSARDGFEFSAQRNKLISKLSARKRGTRLDRFATTPAYLGQPVSPIKVKVKTGAGTKSIASGFWVPARNSGGYLIVVRKEVLRSLGVTKILGGSSPYQALYTSSVHNVFEDTRGDTGDKMGPYFAEKLTAEMAWLLNKYPPPGSDGSDEE